MVTVYPRSFLSLIADMGRFAWLLCTPQKVAVVSEILEPAEQDELTPAEREQLLQSFREGIGRKPPLDEDPAVTSWRDELLAGQRFCANCGTPLSLSATFGTKFASKCPLECPPEPSGDAA